ncbi:SH3 domain-containing protein, partial [Lysinibacillus fusiformis]|uniref:SH3 domain-containing protein n=1 Tax=Lysinibacillus fusiformis TaxID=28031 RepID=UPI003B97BE14
LGAVEFAVTTNGAVNLYVKPTSSAKVISSVEANEKLPVYKTIGGYYLTQVNGLPGYIVANSTTDATGEVKPNPEPTPPPASGDVLGKVTVANLNVCSQGNSTSPVLFKLNKGEYVQVNSIDGYWAEITYSCQTGYV